MVETAYNIIKELNLSPKEREELARMLQGEKRKKRPDPQFEAFKADFKRTLVDLKNK